MNPHPPMAPCPFDVPMWPRDRTGAENLHVLAAEIADRTVPAIERLQRARRVADMAVTALVDIANEAHREGVSWDEIALVTDVSVRESGAS